MAMNVAVNLAPLLQNKISSTLSCNQNTGPILEMNRRKFVVVIGTDSGSRVLSNATPPLGLAGSCTPAGIWRAEFKSTPGTFENTDRPGEKLDVGESGGLSDVGDVGGKVVDCSVGGDFFFLGVGEGEGVGADGSSVAYGGTSM